MGCHCFGAIVFRNLEDVRFLLLGIATGARLTYPKLCQSSWHRESYEIAQGGLAELNNVSLVSELRCV
ncbi:MAG: hypothetical protein JWQ42_4977 [Edaphobacter sp.]|nr:hypothetical protein [Edaphobacter sp.]